MGRDGCLPSGHVALFAADGDAAAVTAAECKTVLYADLGTQEVSVLTNCS